MKLFFSEQKSDYAHYQFPYIIWAVPEDGETPADIFNAGFVPASRFLDRFYLCRQIRVNLAKFKPSSENRRILRKNAGIQMKLVPRAEYDYSPARREFFRTYAAARFSKDTMTYERLDSLFAAPVVSHLLVFTAAEKGQELGTVLMYLENDRMAYYYYAFYDLNYFDRSLGMFMMTSTVEFFAGRGMQHLHLGTCYAENMLYKTQFAGVEFFNGVRWSENLEELKFMIKHDKSEATEHLLDTNEYHEKFYEGDLEKILNSGNFHVKIK